ncbi:MAG: hypothetical protein BWZ02_03271 [Lentisphaerae bacterium ADurb.BinA184]|nr:MAG: hypothetical protein BWZ02_03271 [Lentisphaerae bacterium ADurb.BinA184]
MQGFDGQRGRPAARGHPRNRVRLVHLNANPHVGDSQDARHDAGARQDALGCLQHQTVVGGQAGLALDPVEDQGINLLGRRRREFHVGREGGAAHADEAGVGNAFEQVGGVAPLPVRPRLKLRVRRVLAVAGDLDRGHQRPGRAGAFGDRADCAAGRRMHGGGNKAPGRRQNLALAHRVALLDRQFRRGADVLHERHHVLLQQRCRLDRRPGRQRLAVRRVNAAGKMEPLRHGRWRPSLAGPASGCTPAGRAAASGSGRPPPARPEADSRS